MSRRPRLLLVTPPYHSGVVEAAGVWMPLHYVYLAGAARAAGAEVRIYDAMSLFTTHDDIRKVIEEWKPQVVGITAITAMEPDAREICRTARAVDERIVTVMGNVHPTFMWKELLEDEPALDVVVRGEGEQPIADLMRAVAMGASYENIPGLALRKAGKAFANPSKPFAEDLDALTPAFDLIDWPIYRYRPSPAGSLAIVSSSRGCRQRCSFCSQQKFWERSWRGRTPEAFVAELEMLRDRHGVRVAMLSDETPTVSRSRWSKILDLMIERQVGVELLLETRVVDILRDEDILPRYRQAGVSHIYVGVESTEQATLDLYKKDLEVAHSKKAIELINAHHMVSETSFVLGAPGETKESVARTLELAKWYGPDMAFFLAITPWPYADIYPELKGRLTTHDFRKYNLVEPVMKPDAMSIDEMRSALHRATGHFFHHKFTHLDELTPEKRTFMVSVLKLLIEHSYLGAEMKKMASHATMPEPVRKMVAELGISL